MWPALAEEAARGRPLGHNLLIPLSHASCVVREYADGGHGAVGEPLAVHTVMVQLECYGCAEFEIFAWMWVSRGGREINDGVRVCALGMKPCLSEVADRYYWTVM